MKPIKFPGCNVTFAEDQPEYMPLPGFINKESSAGEFITVWQLEPEEIEEIKETGLIVVQQLTFHEKLTPILITTRSNLKLPGDEQG